MNSSVSSLLSMLPPHSFVMGKGHSATTVEPKGSPDSGCFLCGEATHKVQLFFPGSCSVVFLVESAHPFQGSKEEQLLKKICEAMKIGPEQAGVLVRSPGAGASEWSSCLPFQWKELKTRSPKILIALGRGIGVSFLGGDESPSVQRGRVHTRYDLNLLLTEDLTGMIENPNLKKQAWEDLKLALNVMKA